MTTFDRREDAFEKKFAHDAELQFKAEARRNKLLGLWAAALLGKAGDAAGVAQSDHQLRRTMDEMMQTAIDQIRSEV